MKWLDRKIQDWVIRYISKRIGFSKDQAAEVEDELRAFISFLQDRLRD